MYEQGKIKLKTVYYLMEIMSFTLKWERKHRKKKNEAKNMRNIISIFIWWLFPFFVSYEVNERSLKWTRIIKKFLNCFSIEFDFSNKICFFFFLLCLLCYFIHLKILTSFSSSACFALLHLIDEDLFNENETMTVAIRKFRVYFINFSFHTKLKFILKKKSGKLRLNERKI